MAQPGPGVQGAADARRACLLHAAVVRAANELTSPGLLVLDLAGAGEFANELLGEATGELRKRATKDVSPIVAGAARVTIASSAPGVGVFPDAEGRAALEKARAAGRLLPRQPIAPVRPAAPAQAVTPAPAGALPVPAAIPPTTLPESPQDVRLLGQWVYHDWVFPNEFFGGSIRIDRHSLFGPDGRFAEVRSSISSFRGRSGEVDEIAAEADVRAADRGHWQADGRQLVVRRDNGDIGVYAYEFRRGRLVTDPALERLRKEWTRE